MSTNPCAFTVTLNDALTSSLDCLVCIGVLGLEKPFQKMRLVISLRIGQASRNLSGIFLLWKSSVVAVSVIFGTINY